MPQHEDLDLNNQLTALQYISIDYSSIDSIILETITATEGTTVFWLFCLGHIRNVKLN